MGDMAGGSDRAGDGVADAPAPPVLQEFHRALLDSRQRWRDFGAIATDLVFETDQEGRLSFLAPSLVLGWPAVQLLGQPAGALLAEQREDVPNPFCSMTAVDRRHTWVRQADRRDACLAITAVPLLDAGGLYRGARGVGVDVTGRECRDVQVTAALRRAEVLDHILGQMRQEVMAPRMMQAVLEALLRALGACGAAVLNLAQGDDPETSSVLHGVGEPAGPDLTELLELLRSHGEDPQAGRLADAAQVLACRVSTRFGHNAALALWRGGDGRVWDADERMLVGSVTGLIRIVLEHEAIQREMTRQARTDPLTGLLNRRAFMEETTRRIDRLERDALPGTLMFIDLDRFKPVNDRFGHDVGDAALVLTASVLRASVRPADLVARLGGDEFAIWLDGSDHMTAAERAEHLCLIYPGRMAHVTAGETEGMSMSVGIACREPGSCEELDQLVQRADQAMYEVKRAGRGHWRVSAGNGGP